ncbi:PucR family transcriptional regulator ligand-binding domain-containing protein [Saccharopolyspora sp. NPDC000359]|uniref:PucR family transcriptional regulator n=1 Tax=Saccharopolyspora sp. NPDC000359 TaxID=3154251 RepID=UPI0033262AD6
MSVPELLAERSLRLVPRTSHCATSVRPISWVSTTELPDPVPFLRGAELVLTTGMQERSDEQWWDLVDRLARLPVAALCFGTGLVHRAVPDVVVRAAEECGLALVESPCEVPFIQISHWVADQIFAAQYDAVRANVAVQDELVRALLDGNGLTGLLSRLHVHLGRAPVAVLGVDGAVLAKFPQHAAPPDPGARRPVEIDRVPVAQVCADIPAKLESVLSFAANILGLEIARHQAVLTGRRELLGQVVEDVLEHVISDREARARLLRARVPIDEPNHVVLAVVDGPADRLRRLPWAVGQLVERRDDHQPTAVIDGTALLIVPAAADAAGVAAELRDRLAVLDPQVGVGVSTARTGVRGLRIGHAEARQASAQGPGVHPAGPLSVTGLLAGSVDLPLRDLAETTLARLLRYDAEHDGELLRTLRAYLDHDCSPSATAQALTVHRNSLRYRLGLIEQLTGRDLARLTDRIELWFAVRALSPGAGGP